MGKATKQSASKSKRHLPAKSDPVHDSASGIYVAAKRSLNSPEALAAYMERFDLDKVLAEIETSCRSILAEHGFDARPVRIPLPEVHTQVKGVQRVFGGFSGVPSDPPILKDADDAMFRIQCVREGLAKGDARLAALNGFFLGLVVERMGVRLFEPLVLVGKETAMIWRGCTLRVSDMERQILEAIGNESTRKMIRFVSEVWHEPYEGELQETPKSRSRRLAKYRKAIHVVNGKLLEAEVPITLSIRGDTLLIDAAV